MTEHNLIYYPYASFTNEQLPLLKIAALYFDKLYILDPVDASWNTVGADDVARNAVQLLKNEGILELVKPSDVLSKYEAPIVEAIRRDMSDPEFLALCDAHSQASGKQWWTLALAKVPQDIQTDQAMRELMGNFARNIAGEANQYSERPLDYISYAEIGQVFDEMRMGYGGEYVEYRYADYPLALGESIMMNHALFTGLMYSNATPITDDPFHSQVLSLKLRRAIQDPIVHQAQIDRARQHKIDLLAVSTMIDRQLNLPVLNPKLTMEDVLEYRQTHGDALREARDKLGWMARRIESEPWTKEFVDEIEHETIPDIADKLSEVRKANERWLKSDSGRKALEAAGIIVGGASFVLSVFTTSIAPLALSIAGVEFLSKVGIPGAEWLLKWRDGEKTVKENGLHYLLKI